MKILFVDDQSIRYIQFMEKCHRAHEVWYCTQPQTAIETLLDPKHRWDMVFLDHDLMWEKDCQANGQKFMDGRDIVDAIVENPEKFRQTVFIVHSANEPGRLAMVNTLRDNGLAVESSPFCWNVPHLLEIIDVWRKRWLT